MGELGFRDGFEVGDDVLHVFDPWVGFDLQGVMGHHEFKVGNVLMVLAAALQAMLPGGWGWEWILYIPGFGVWVGVIQVVVLGLVMVA